MSHSVPMISVMLDHSSVVCTRTAVEVLCCGSFDGAVVDAMQIGCGFPLKRGVQMPAATPAESEKPALRGAMRRGSLVGSLRTSTRGHPPTQVYTQRCNVRLRFAATA